MPRLPVPDRSELRSWAHVARAYGIAVGSTLAATILTSLLLRIEAPSGTLTITPLFFAAVTISAWLGGLGPGLLASVLGTLVIDYLFVPPRLVLNFTLFGAIRATTFLSVSLLISVLTEAQRAAHRRLTASAATTEAALRAVEAQAARLREQAVALEEQTEAARLELAERVRAEAGLRFRAHLLNTVEEAVVAADAEMRVTYWNGFAERLYGWSVHEALDRSLLEFAAPEQMTMVRTEILGRLADGQPWTGELLMRRKDGSTFPAWVNAAPLRDPEGRFMGMVGAATDLTERKRLEEQLAHLAFHDSLTGVPNRALFLDRVSHALERAPREERTVAVLFLDLDDFKATNDTLGHVVGDELLVAVADRIRHTVRLGDTAARLGGDEFAVLVEDMHGADEVAELARRLTTAFQAPFEVAGHTLHVSASIGWVVATAADTAGDLLRHADVAMYSAKLRGRGRAAAFAPDMLEARMARVALESGLRRALGTLALPDPSRRELHVVYQPIVDMRHARPTAFEALTRWHDPELGEIPPVRFIPIAEETGMIVPLGRWVLREACRAAAGWRRNGLNHLAVTVNVSGRQLAEPSFVTDVEDALAVSGLKPSGLTLEITESVLIHHAAEVPARLAALKALGVRLAIDDFGTGYSSLGYLQHVPADVLKIDRTFVHALGGASRDAVIAGAVVALGTALGMSTVAEGVETADQVRQLRSMGCRHAQGYYYAPPLLPVDVPAAMGNGR